MATNKNQKHAENHKSTLKIDKHTEADVAYRASFPELNPNPVVELDLEGRLVYLNPAAKSIFPGIDILGVKHPLLGNWSQLVRKLKDTKQSEVISREVKLGNLIYKQMIALLANNQIRIYAQDITESKKAEEDLIQSKAYLRAILNSTGDGILVVDDHQTIISANIHFLEMFGIPRDLIIKKDDNPVLAQVVSQMVEPEAFFIKVKELYHSDKIDRDTLHLKDGRVIERYSEPLVLQEKIAGRVWSFRDTTELILAEEGLKRSEQKYRLIVEKSTDIIFSFNAAGEFLYVSPSIKNLLGYDPNDLIGHPFQSLIHPADIPVIERAIQRNIRDGSQAPGGNRFRVRHASGEWRWHNTTGNAVYDASGKFVYFIAISRDITEHKKAEELLQATEQNFRNSLDASPMGIRIIDSERRSLYVNQEFLNIFGYKNIYEVGDYPMQDHYTPEEHIKFLSRQEKRARGELVPANMRVEIKGKDGTIRYLEVSDSEVIWDGKSRREIIYKDVTENELAKRALQESEERYRLIVENSTDIVFTLDNTGRFIYLSPSITNVLGYEPLALIGVPFCSLVHPDDVHVINEGESSPIAARTQFSKNEEYRFRNASGQWRWLSSTGTSMRERHEKSFNFVGIARDITQQKASEEEKRVLEEKAQIASRLASLGEMAAGIAHEINNPLTGVIGFSQLLLEKENVPEDIKSELRVIADGSERVASIVKRLLTFARQTKPNRTLANVNELVDNTLKLRGYVLKTSNIEVVTRFDPELPWSVIDPGQIQQVFLNLIVNAEQAMKKAHGKGTLAITTEKMGNRIHISFQDDGPGITREHLRHLFEPFFTTKEPGEGTGLGLSLSRSIVLEHGGRMWVQSEPGHGAIFVVEIPIIESLPLDETKPLLSEVKLGANKKIKILVVDDESAIRELLEKLFKQMGNTIDSFSDANSAIDQLDAGTIYDVILVDIRMPGMSGEEFYTRIVKINPALKGKVIIITGDVMGPDIKDFLKKNDLPHLVKPFDVKVLKEQVEAIATSKVTS